MKVGIVGCGSICEQHLQILERIPMIEVISVCEKDNARARKISETYSVPKVYSDIREMLINSSPDVVHILTPPQNHLEIARFALEEGCHVLVEKPMAMNTEEAGEMVSIARREKRILGVSHNYIFTPAFLKAKALIKDGALGEILGADIFWRMSTYNSKKRKAAAKWMKELPGGVIHEVIPHLVYTLSDIMGQLKLSSVVARPYGNEDNAEFRALLETNNGPATMGLSLNACPVQKFMKIHGTKMSLHLDFATNVLIKQSNMRDGKIERAMINFRYSVQLIKQTIENGLKTIIGNLQSGHESLIDNFYTSLLNKESPYADGEKGLATVAFLDTLWEAMKKQV